jgi:hypothetical protein
MCLRLNRDKRELLVSLAEGRKLLLERMISFAYVGYHLLEMMSRTDSTECRSACC